jgi:pimeloyl-ACP methyl ester carboxylesterase/DNA-binding CsgD family transcriptional regulator
VNQQIRFCTSLDGARIAYATTGSGPPLVMSATWLTHLEQQWHSLAWRPWLEALSQSHTLLRYDPRGCGLSDRHATDISFATWINDFEAVIDAAGFDRFPVLGVCQGGPIAVEYTARHPKRVNRLVLYGTYARGRSKREGSPKEAEKAQVLLDLTKLGWGKENHAFVQVWASQFQPGGSLDHLQSWSALQNASTSAETAAQLMRVTFDIDVQASARRVRCPTLIIHPDHGSVVPIEEARILGGLIDGSCFIEIDTINHMPLADEPAWQKLLDELQQFLARDLSEPDFEALTKRLIELTKREREVLNEIAQGLDNTQIAVRLDLAEKTVRNHITNVFDKIGVDNRYQAIVLAREAGLGQIRRLVS